MTTHGTKGVNNMDGKGQENIQEIMNRIKGFIKDGAENYNGVWDAIYHWLKNDTKYPSIEPEIKFKMTKRNPINGRLIK